MAGPFRFDGARVIKIEGADVLAPLAARARLAAASAEEDAGRAELAAAGATAAANLFPTTAAGLAATAPNGYFTVAGDGANTYAILYRKVNGAAVEQARYASKGAYEGAGGAGLIGTTLNATGATVRNQADANEDVLDVWDFMTPAMKASVIAGNLQVDTASAFQAAFDHASGRHLPGTGHGRRVKFRGGTYRWDTPVHIDWRVEAKVVDAGDMRRPAVEGEGSADTVIFYTGAASTPALTIAGYASGANGGVDLFLTMRGFWLRRIFSAAQTGVGMRLVQASYVHMEDVAVDQFATNLDMTDCIRIHAVGCRFTGATETLYARVSTYSHPNVYKFDRCDFGGNFKRIGRFVTPSNVVFEDCGMEGNGDGTDHLIQIIGGSQEGGCAIEIRGGYIENNYAKSEIFLNWTAANLSGTALITGVSFNKTNSTNTVTNHVLVSAEPPSAGKLKVSVESCAFKGFPRAGEANAYAPSSSRPAIAQTANSANALVTITACHFDYDVERPQFNGWPAIGEGYSQKAAVARWNADGSFIAGWNIVPGNVRTGVGTYALSFKQPLRSGTLIGKFMPVAGPGTAAITAESATGCTVSTYNASGALADVAMCVEIQGLLN